MKYTVLFLSLVLFASCSSTEKIYVGTGSPEGMFLIELDEGEGTLKKLYQQGDVKSPGFLTFCPNKKYLYCVASENKIRSYKIEADGSLSFLNEKPSTGKGPCHIEISKSGKAVVVANYGSGDTTVVSVADDGSFKGEPRNHSHKGFKSPSKSNRQQGPHAHNVKMSPDGKYCFVSDLGLDKIVTYKFDENYETLSLNNPSYAVVATGAGPRHFTFHQNGKFAYVINELDSTVSVFHYTGNGKLNLKQTLSTKPADWTEYNNCADIHVHPNGRFLYGSNRGNNSIVIFEINPTDGKLTLVGHESTRGNWPRNFAISPSGNYLLVANRRTNDVQVFEVNKETGKLSHKSSLELPAPICLKFFSK